MGDVKKEFAANNSPRSFAIVGKEFPVDGDAEEALGVTTSVTFGAFPKELKSETKTSFRKHLKPWEGQTGHLFCLKTNTNSPWIHVPKLSDGFHAWSLSPGIHFPMFYLFKAS